MTIITIYKCIHLLIIDRIMMNENECTLDKVGLTSTVLYKQ